MSDSKATVVIADDNEDNLFVLESLLAHMGHTVHRCVNGAEALAKAAEVHPDLIFMDLDMPVMSGWEASRHIRTRGETEGIPIIAISAHSTLGDQEETLQRGYLDDFIGKPFAPQEILSKVEAVLRGELRARPIERP